MNNFCKRYEKESQRYRILNNSPERIINQAGTHSETNIKHKKIKILPTTERLFERICYLTKLSLKSGKGTKVLVDPFDWSNCSLLCVCDRTIRTHLKILCEAGMIRRMHESKHIYELHKLVLSDLLYKNHHSFYRVYLGKINENICETDAQDSPSIFSNCMEKKSEAYIYKNQENKSYKSSEQKEGYESPEYTVQEAVMVMNEELGKIFCCNQLNQYTAKLIGGARKWKFKTLKMFRHYCKSIKESWIYHSRRIHNRFIYMLKFNVIDSFLPKLESEPHSTPEECFQEQLLHIKSIDESEECKIFRRRMLDIHGAYVYKSWISKVRLTTDNNDNLLIEEAPSAFVADYVENNYLRGDCLR
jgi:hypothetical protein